MGCNIHYAKCCLGVAAEGHRSCEPCLKAQREKMAAHRQACKQNGVCYRCGNPARPGGLLCEAHRSEVREQERRDRGTPYPSCEICGEPAYTHARYCKPHIAEGKKRERKARHIQKVNRTRCPACHIWGHHEKHCAIHHPEFVPRPPNSNGFIEGEVIPLTSKRTTSPPVLTPGTMLRSGERCLLPSIFEGQATLSCSTGVQVRVVSVLKNGRVVVEHEGALYFLRGQSWRNPLPDAPSEPKALPDDLLDLALEDLLVPVRAQTVFAKLHLKTVRDLVEVGPAGLLQQKNVGRKTIQDIRAALTKVGVLLKTEEVRAF